MKTLILVIQKKSENICSLFVSKKSLCSSFLAIFFFVLLYPLGASAQECSFTLTASNNIESVNKDGRVYFIQLQNNSKEDMTINLSATNLKSGSNPDKSDSTANVGLKATITNEEGQEIKGTVTLKSNEILKFQVKVIVPAGTPFGHWNIILLSATSDKCKDYSESIKLFTFIPNPDEK